MINFKATVDNLKMVGLDPVPNRIEFNIPNSKEVLNAGFECFLSKEKVKSIWLPEYDEIAEWMTNNKGRGLLMYGNCGRGKSIIGRFIIPAVLTHYCRKICTCYDAEEMNKKIDEVLNKHILSIDDIGTEGMSVNYGVKRMAFAEIMDAVEKKGKLIIISSNLSGQALRERYGDRVFDRIIATTKRIAFNGDSLRK